jgi:protein-S-isoprenylcysteine O-methyltransferase Ste14
MNKEKIALFMKYFRGILYFFGIPALMFLFAGTLRWWQAWVYIGISYVASIISRVLMSRVHPDLAEERANYSKKTDVKKWDKYLMPFVAIICPAAYFSVAGLDHRFGWSSLVSPGFYVFACVFTIAFYVFSTWAFVTNRFFSAVARIQTDRGQTVIDTGPYRFIRHPGYLAGIIVALLFPLMLGSWWAIIPVFIMCILVVLRTALEDNMLINELPGYADYARKTKYRLIPGIW